MQGSAEVVDVAGFADEFGEFWVAIHWPGIGPGLDSAEAAGKRDLIDRFEFLVPNCQHQVIADRPLDLVALSCHGRPHRLETGEQ